MRFLAKALFAAALFAAAPAFAESGPKPCLSGASDSGHPLFRSDFHLASQKAKAEHGFRGFALLFVSEDCEGCEGLYSHFLAREHSQKALRGLEIQAIDAYGSRKRVHFRGDRLVSEADLAREFKVDPKKPTLVVLSPGYEGEAEYWRWTGFRDVFEAISGFR